MEKGKSIVIRSQHNNYSRTNDHSKLKILLCDANAESCQEILSLLCKCSYQVVAVRTAREALATLNSDQGPHPDIILAEVSVLMANDAHVMRHIMHKQDLQRIPVIIVTTQDEVSTTIKGLRLGAADFLVKPLQVDELSNLWMHSHHK